MCRTTVLVLSCLALAAVARWGGLTVVQASRPKTLASPDTLNYEGPALALLHLGKLARSVDHPDTPAYQRTPGYPVFIAAVGWIFGPGRPAVAAAQILLSLGTLTLVYLAGLRLWRRRTAALCALALAGLDPASYYYSHLILSETVFTFLLIAAMFGATAVTMHGARRAPWAALSVGCLALATLVRPVTYYAIAPFALFLALGLARPRRSWRRAALWGMAAAAIWIAAIGGWQWRNLHETGLGRFNRIEALNLYLYRAAGVVALRDGVSFQKANARLDRESQAALQGASLRERDEYYRREARAILRAHPGLVLRSCAKGLALLTLHPNARRLYVHLTGDAEAENLTSDLKRLSPGTFFRKWIAGRPLLPALTLIEIGVLFSFYLGLPAALWLQRRRIRRRWRTHILWLGMLAYLVAVSSGPEASARLRAPLTPFFALYGGWALAWAGARLGRERRPPCATPEHGL